MTALRTTVGINLNYVETSFGDENKNRILLDAQKFIDSGRLILQEDRLYLSREGKFFADGIAGDLFG